MASGCDLEHTTQKLLAANHTEIPVTGTVVIQANIGSTMVTIRALVLQHVHETMLGIDWLERTKYCGTSVHGAVTIMR